VVAHGVELRSDLRDFHDDVFLLLVFSAGSVSASLPHQGAPLLGISARQMLIITPRPPFPLFSLLAFQ